MSGTGSPAGGGTPSGIGVPNCHEQLDAISTAVAASTATARSQSTCSTALLKRLVSGLSCHVNNDRRAKRRRHSSFRRFLSFVSLGACATLDNDQATRVMR